MIGCIFSFASILRRFSYGRHEDRKGRAAEAYDGTGEHIVIPEGVSSIAEKAFQGKPIKSVQFPHTVSWIGAHSFQGTALEEVVLSFSSEIFAGGYLRRTVVS